MWQDNNVSSKAEPTDLALVLFTFAYIKETEIIRSNSGVNFNELSGATSSLITCVWGIIIISELRFEKNHWKIFLDLWNI